MPLFVLNSVYFCKVIFLYRPVKMPKLYLTVWKKPPFFIQPGDFNPQFVPNSRNFSPFLYLTKQGIFPKKFDWAPPPLFVINWKIPGTFPTFSRKIPGVFPWNSQYFPDFSQIFLEYFIQIVIFILFYTYWQFKTEVFSDKII